MSNFSNLSFNKKIMVCLLSSTLVLGSTSMAFENDIPEDYPYDSFYDHSQGQDKGLFGGTFWLVSLVTSAITQKVEKGKVDWGQVFNDADKGGDRGKRLDNAFR